MAKKTTEKVGVAIPETVKAPAKKTPVKKTRAKKTPAKKEPETLAEYRAEIAEFVKKYDEHSMFNEQVKMSKLEAAAKEDAKKHNELAESEAFQTLKAAADPMKALALMKSYTGIVVRAVLDKDTKRSKLEVVEKQMTLDPLRLHKRVSDGIGHDKQWPGKVGRLWDNLVAEGAFRLGLDAKKIRDTIYVGDATKLLKFKCEDKGFGDEMLKDCLQEVLDAMLGPGYEARMDLVQKMKNEVGKTPSDVANSGNISPDQFRKRFVGVLYRTVTGTPVELETKGRKR